MFLPIYGKKVGKNIAIHFHMMYIFCRGGVPMQQIYSECTCCYRPLTDVELQKNKEKENYYYTICDDCLDKFTAKIIQIVNE